jgi:hypothetical protein
MLDPLFRQADAPTAAMARLAFESPEFGERAAAHVALNRKLGRAMPAEKASRVVALRIIEWAHGQDAEDVAPADVANYRVFCRSPFVDEAHWRTAYDLALGIWKQGYDEHLRKQAAF